MTEQCEYVKLENTYRGKYDIKNKSQPPTVTQKKLETSAKKNQNICFQTLNKWCIKYSPKLEQTTAADTPERLGTQNWHPSLRQDRNQ